VINFPYYVYQLPIQNSAEGTLQAAFRLSKRGKIKKKELKRLYKNMSVYKWINLKELSIKLRA
jgi:hypothetical protein